MKEYDIMVVGPVSLDHNIDYLGNERKEVGGAVVASGFAAAGSGAKTAIFCKSNAADADVKERFAGVNADLYWAACHLLHPQPVLHRRQGKAGLHLYGRVRPLPF